MKENLLLQKYLFGLYKIRSMNMAAVLKNVYIDKLNQDIC